MDRRSYFLPLAGAAAAGASSAVFFFFLPSKALATRTFGSPKGLRPVANRSSSVNWAIRSPRVSTLRDRERPSRVLRVLSIDTSTLQSHSEFKKRFETSPCFEDNIVSLISQRVRPGSVPQSCGVYRQNATFSTTALPVFLTKCSLGQTKTPKLAKIYFAERTRPRIFVQSGRFICPWSVRQRQHFVLVPENRSPGFRS